MVEMKLSGAMGLSMGKVIKFREVISSFVVKFKISYFTDFTIHSFKKNILTLKKVGCIL